MKSATHRQPPHRTINPVAAVWHEIQQSGLAILFIDHPNTLQLSNISPIISRKNLTTQYRVSNLLRALIDWTSR